MVAVGPLNLNVQWHGNCYKDVAPNLVARQCLICMLAWQILFACGHSRTDWWPGVCNNTNLERHPRTKAVTWDRPSFLSQSPLYKNWLSKLLLLGLAVTCLLQPLLYDFTYTVRRAKGNLLKPTTYFESSRWYRTFLLLCFSVSCEFGFPVSSECFY